MLALYGVDAGCDGVTLQVRFALSRAFRQDAANLCGRNQQSRSHFDAGDPTRVSELAPCPPANAGQGFAIFRREIFRLDDGSNPRVERTVELKWRGATGLLLL